MKSTLLLIGCLFSAALVAQDKTLPVLQYVDGNGNSYEFTEDGGSYTLEFEPVKKTTKSGSYSGGEPATRRVSKDNFDKLLARMDKAIKRKISSNRERGTALIIKSVKGDQKEYVLPKNSGDIKEIEALLYALF
jgi:hypothetical protein